MNELMARLRAAVRRGRTAPAEAPTVETGDLEADPAHPRHLITSPGPGYLFETSA